MEQIMINGKVYNFVYNFRNDDKLRSSFNNLTKNTYGFDFENWYRSGYWQERYIPYSIMDGDKIVSNVSVNVIDFSILGERKKLIQLGTVMTDEKYRNKGLNKYIMSRVLEEWKGKCDNIYLFANDSVLEFYPKFGFEKANEYQYSAMTKSENKEVNADKLDMSDETNREFLIDKINKSMSLSKISMKNNADLVMFYCTSFMRDNVYYIKKYDTIVIAEFDNERLYLYDIFSEKDVNLNEIVDMMVTKKTNKVVFEFTPNNTENYNVEILNEEDTTLFVMKKDNMLLDKKLRFPVLSRA